MNENEMLAQVLRNIDRDVEAEERLRGIYTGVRRYVAARNGKRCDRRDLPALIVASTGEHGWYKSPGLDTMLGVRFTSREETTWNRERAREEVSWNSPEHAICLHAGAPGANARFDLEWFDRENDYASKAGERADRLRAMRPSADVALAAVTRALVAIEQATRYVEALHEGGRHVGEVAHKAIVEAVSKIPGVYVR